MLGKPWRLIRSGRSQRGNERLRMGNPILGCYSQNLPMRMNRRIRHETNVAGHFTMTLNICAGGFLLVCLGLVGVLN